MIDPILTLRQRLATATRAAFGDEAAQADPAIHRSQHADYQADLALALAKRLKKNPREVATAIAAGLPTDDAIAAVAVSGPGFINLTLQPAFLSAQLHAMLADPRLGVPLVATPQTVVIDYSAPNVAKEMHVGHLRTTVIGDALARVLEWQGHKVVRQNHIGDWGTPFGMLIEHLVDERTSGAEAGVRQLVAFYQAARAKFDADPAFAERARARVVRLQGGDAETLALWRRLIDVSVEHFNAMYARLGVTLRPGDVRGESFYNPVLADVVAELAGKGLARESEGAMCVFPPGFTGREGEPVPLIIRKREGGYGYATTDLAALRYRVRELGAHRVIYVVGSPQSQHLAMVFAAARLAGWAPETIRLEHVGFGSILGPDKKMFKTRSGDTVSLASLVDEGIERATKVVEAKSQDLEPAERARVAEAVGVGAIKYADLCNDRIKDYVFDWDRMLALDGNTAVYSMYAHARARSILRKTAGLGVPGTIVLGEPAEKALALEIVALGGVVEKTAESLEPHRLCGFLYQVATAFTSFYDKCPVRDAEPATRASRLSLCRLTAETLSRGLDLLGIGAPEQM
jgi:arginyl-tRNA synthetase